MIDSRTPNRSILEQVIQNGSVGARPVRAAGGLGAEAGATPLVEVEDRAAVVRVDVGRAIAEGAWTPDAAPSPPMAEAPTDRAPNPDEGGPVAALLPVAEGPPVPAEAPSIAGEPPAAAWADILAAWARFFRPPPSPAPKAPMPRSASAVGQAPLGALSEGRLLVAESEARSLRGLVRPLLGTLAFVAEARRALGHGAQAVDPQQHAAWHAEARAWTERAVRSARALLREAPATDARLRPLLSEVRAAVGVLLASENPSLRQLAEVETVGLALARALGVDVDAWRSVDHLPVGRAAPPRQTRAVMWAVAAVVLGLGLVWAWRLRG